MGHKTQRKGFQTWIVFFVLYCPLVDRGSQDNADAKRWCVGPVSHLVILFDDVLRCQTIVLQVSGQVEHVVGQLLLQVVVMLQDGLQLCGRLALIQRETSARRRLDGQDRS